MNKYAAFTKKHNMAKEVENFLRHLKIQPASQDMRGITWIELYIHFRQLGFNRPLAHQDRKAKAQPTLDKQLREFKRLVHAVTAGTLIDSPDYALFKPRQGHNSALLGLGIKGKFQGPSFNILLNQDMSDKITCDLIKLGRKISKDKTAQFIRGAAGLKPLDLSYKGKNPGMRQSVRRALPTVLR